MFTISQILICGLIYWLAEANLPFVMLWTLQKPLVCGWAAGLVLGAPVQGAAAGAILSVILLSFSSAGSSMPVDLALAGITGAALTSAGWDPYAAVLPALLAGISGRYVWKLRMRVNVLFARQVRALIGLGKTTEILLPAILFPALFALAVCLPVSGAVLLLCDLVLRQAALPGSGCGILAAAAGLLPAGGLAFALSAVDHQTACLRITGRRADGTEEENIFTDPDEESGLVDPDEDEPEVPGPEAGDTGRPRTLLSRSALGKSALLWLLFLHICYNNEWMMGQVMALVFLPLVRQLAPQDREGQRAILLRQSTYFNTHCECGACIPGLMAAMEEGLALDPDRSQDAEDEILMIRTSLMGVCGALGDTLFQKHMIPLLLMTACLLTALLPQLPAGPVLYTLLMTLLSFTIGMRSFFRGYYSTPMQLLERLEKNIYRRAEKGMEILLLIFSIPTAALFVRFPFQKGTAPGFPGSLAGGPMSGLAAMLTAGLAAVFLTILCLLAVKKRHWRKRPLFLLLILTGAAAGLLI